MNQLKTHTHNKKNKAKRLRATNFTINWEKSNVVIAILEKLFRILGAPILFLYTTNINPISSCQKKCAETKSLTYVKQ